MRVELRPTVASDLAYVTHETLPIRIRAITAVLREPRSLAPSPLEGEGWGGGLSPRVPLPPPPSLSLPHKGGGNGDGDRVLGIGGIGYRPDGVVIGFAAINEEFRAYPHALHRAGLAMMKIIRESGVSSVIAIADERVEPAERWLERLGFRPVLERGVKLYVWNARVSKHG